MQFIAKDCSPLEPQPDPKEAASLRDLKNGLSIGKHLVSLSQRRDDQEPIVYCDVDGVWWAGRYIGNITYKGISLRIEPRFGIDTILNWLSGPTAIQIVPSEGTLKQSPAFITLLLSSIWIAKFIEASRHGLPALRIPSTIQSTSIQGVLDVRQSIKAIATKSYNITSVRIEKTLDHDVSRVIVAAYDVLRRWGGIPNIHYLPPRLREFVPILIAVTGQRPKIPLYSKLEKIRYTPINAGFSPLAKLSYQIAKRRGLMSDPDPESKSTGVLLDIAEIWEMYLLHVVRLAFPSFEVIHGTRDATSNKHLLRSHTSGEHLGKLIPDLLIRRDGITIGVIDAKYKSIERGPKREDLYQLTSYLSRYGNQNKTWGILAYPKGFDPESESLVDSANPWRLTNDQNLLFLRVPHHPKEAAEFFQKQFLHFQLSSTH